MDGFDEGEPTKRDLLDLLDAVYDLVDEKLDRLRTGSYSERLDGTLQEVLEEIERVLG